MGEVSHGGRKRAEKGRGVFDRINKIGRIGEANRRFSFPSLVPKFHLGTFPVPREISFRANWNRFFQQRSAVKLPQQVRSQVQLGNEGKIGRIGDGQAVVRASLKFNPVKNFPLQPLCFFDLFGSLCETGCLSFKVAVVAPWREIGRGFTRRRDGRNGEAGGTGGGNGVARTSAFPSATWERGEEGRERQWSLGNGNG